jgi:hypothetical protein
MRRSKMSTWISSQAFTDQASETRDSKIGAGVEAYGDGAEHGELRKEVFLGWFDELRDERLEKECRRHSEALNGLLRIGFLYPKQIV